MIATPAAAQTSEKQRAYRDYTNMCLGLFFSDPAAHAEQCLGTNRITVDNKSIGSKVRGTVAKPIAQPVPPPVEVPPVEEPKPPEPEYKPDLSCEAYACVTVLIGKGPPGLQGIYSFPPGSGFPFVPGDEDGPYAPPDGEHEVEAIGPFKEVFKADIYLSNDVSGF